MQSVSRRRAAAWMVDPSHVSCVGSGTVTTEGDAGPSALSVAEATVANARLGIFWVRADGSIAFANREACRFLGYSPQELADRSYLDIDANFTTETWERFWNEVRSAGVVIHESQHRRRNGDVFPVEATVNSLEFNGDEYACIFARNISRRWSADKALRHRLAMERMVAWISSRFIALSPGQVDREIDRALSGLLEFVGVDRSYVFLVSPDGRRLSNTHEACAAGVRSWKADMQDLPADGFPWAMGQLRELQCLRIPRVVELPPEAAAERALLESHGVRSAAVVPLVERGQLVGLLGFSSLSRELTWPQADIALLKMVGEILAGALARRNAERALRESEQKYRTLTDNSPDVVMRFDEAARHLFVSRSITRYTDRAPGEFLGRTHRQLGFPEPLAEFWERHVAQAFAGGGSMETQFELAGPQGSVEFECKVIPERDADGRIVSVLAVGRDITERKRLEAQLLHSQKMEAIGQLAGGIAHDFNNLLTGILGYANVSPEAQPDTLAFEAAKTIEKAGERAAELTRQLLGFARRGKYMSVPVDLHEVVREVVNLLGRTLDKNIAIIQRLSADISLVQGDPNQLEQAILNLAVNARDAMPEGGELSLETHVARLDEDFCRRYLGVEPGPYLVVCVGDTGVGIPREIQDRIFEPFFTTKEQGKGTGMGLAMVYGIVRNHGGAIRVYSEVGRGSVFKVYLPLLEKPREAPVTPAGDAPRRGSGRILLVDDDEVVRKVGADMLRSLGYDVTPVCGGREAVEFYRRIPTRSIWWSSIWSCPKWAAATAIVRSARSIPRSRPFSRPATAWTAGCRKSSWRECGDSCRNPTRSPSWPMSSPPSCANPLSPPLTRAVEGFAGPDKTYGNMGPRGLRPAWPCRVLSVLRLIPDCLLPPASP
ncbi:PAS domain S-box protein [bacterium]|nr:PAS domain S-box protein [bacterium]